MGSLLVKTTCSPVHSSLCSSLAWTSLGCCVFLAWCLGLFTLFPSCNKYPTSQAFSSEHMQYDICSPLLFLNTKYRETPQRGARIVNSNRPATLGSQWILPIDCKYENPWTPFHDVFPLLSTSPFTAFG